MFIFLRLKGQFVVSVRNNGIYFYDGNNFLEIIPL